MSPRSLTAKEARFVEEYLVDLNATQAAIRAGYAPASARQTASRKLSRVNIAAEIARAQQRTSERNEYQVDDFTRDLLEQVNADLSDLFDADGSLLPLEQWPPVWRRGLVKSLKVREYVDHEGRTVRKFSLRFADRTPLKAMLGRHVGAFR